MQDFVKITTIENEVEAQLLEVYLNDNAIPHLMQTYHDTAYDGVYQATMGWGCIQALPEHKDEILQYLTNLRNGEEVDLD